MSKNRKVKHSKKEELHARKVVRITFISMIALGAAIIIGFSLFG
jgi:hypothetical protein